jgi:hypothetical protein
LINYSPATIRSIEGGRLQLSKVLAAIISSRTGVALEWLLENNPEAPMPPVGYSFTADDFGQLQDISYRTRFLSHLFALLFAEAGKLEKSTYRDSLEIFIGQELAKLKATWPEDVLPPSYIAPPEILDFAERFPEFNWVNFKCLKAPKQPPATGN